MRLFKNKRLSRKNNIVDNKIKKLKNLCPEDIFKERRENWSKGRPSHASIFGQREAALQIIEADIKAVHNMKAWYDLLEQYNHLIKEKEYNKNLADTESLEGIKEKILHYLHEDALKRAEADAQMFVMDICKQGLTNAVTKNMFSGTWFAKWAVKADNIIAAVNEERIIAKEDMENSYYGARFLGGRVNFWQYMAIWAGLFIVTAIIMSIIK